MKDLISINVPQVISKVKEYLGLKTEELNESELKVICDLKYFQ